MVRVTALLEPSTTATSPNSGRKSGERVETGCTMAACHVQALVSRSPDLLPELGDVAADFLWYE